MESVKTIKEALRQMLDAEQLQRLNDEAAAGEIYDLPFDEFDFFDRHADDLLEVWARRLKDADKVADGLRLLVEQPHRVFVGVIVREAIATVMSWGEI